MRRRNRYSPTPPLPVHTDDPRAILMHQRDYLLCQADALRHQIEGLDLAINIVARICRDSDRYPNGPRPLAGSGREATRARAEGIAQPHPGSKERDK